MEVGVLNNFRLARKKGKTMRFGICAPLREITPLTSVPFDYLEENVQRFLAPERPQAYFEQQLQAARALPVSIEAAN